MEEESESDGKGKQTEKEDDEEDEVEEEEEEESEEVDSYLSSTDELVSHLLSSSSSSSSSADSEDEEAESSPTSMPLPVEYALLKHTQAVAQKRAVTSPFLSSLLHSQLSKGGKNKQISFSAMLKPHR